MYILYIDDSGSVENLNEKVFVLAGVALFERHVYHLNKALDEIAASTGLEDPETLEFHGSEILPGSKRWRALRGKERRSEVMERALRAATLLRGDWRLFGAVIEKAALRTDSSQGDPVEVAFAQIVSRFNQFLARTRREGRDQRGILVIDESTKSVRFRGERVATATKLKQLVMDYRGENRNWRQANWIVDVPFFVESRTTRAMQFADLVAYATRLYFERGEDRFFNIIKDRFDTRHGVVHGFYHLPYAKPDCDCPYCASRRTGPA